MAEKKYYWLKLKSDFFSSKRIKKLRKLAGGDTYTIIYLKMQLLALKTDGVLTYTGLEKSFAEELALDLDEEVENVQVTLSYLSGCNLIETSDDISFFLPYVLENTGHDGTSTQRVREFRARKMLHETQCNTNETQCNTFETERNTEIEIEKEIDKEIEIEKEIEIDILIALPLNDKSEFPVSKKDVDEWQEAFPSVDILAELRKMKSWLNDNPTRRKTKSGIRRFVNLWLSREQDKPKAQTLSNPFLEMLKEMEDEQN